MSDSPFAALGLNAELVATLVALGYEAPTPIQERTIPVLLAGRDAIGQAQTGTGKTAAFALPMLTRIDPKKNETQGLVLAPTRELAMQVAEAIHSYAVKMPHITVLPVYGGAPIVHQLKRLERGVHIVVGTPGRLLDMLDRKALRLGALRMVVLDEADEMLKMGFIEDVETILKAAPADRQTALFSATMPDEVLRIAKRHLRDPERIELEHRSIAAPAIEQRVINLSEGQKLDVLTQILELETNEATLIFRRTRNGAAELAEKLEGRGFASEAMHGDMNQSQRESVIRRLRNGQVEIVVATDVAARGLDVEQITHVINYDVPHDVEAYVHRIGRTGRAGRTGVATLFVTPRERRMLREIERFTGKAIKPMKMPSRADVTAKRVSLFKETLRKNIELGDLDLYVSLIEQLAEEGPFDVADIAAAAARLANGSRSLADDGKEASSSVPRFLGSSGGEAEPRTPEPRKRGAGRPARDPSDAWGDPDEKKVRMAMAVGRRDGIRPADVVGSIANEADIPGRDIGPIDIRETVTFVTIPERNVAHVLDKVGRAKFRGRPVNLRVADDEEGDGPERPERPARGGEGGAARGARAAKRPSPFPRQDDRPPRRGNAPFRPGAAFKPKGKGPPKGKRPR